MGPRCGRTIARQRGGRTAGQHAAIRGAHTNRVDDEPLRCRPDVVERITGDERQRVGVERAQHRHVRRLDDFRVAHEVLEVAARRLHRQAIADEDVLEWPEKTVTMRGDRAVAGFPWERRVREMAHRHVERILVVA